MRSDTADSVLSEVRDLGPITASELAAETGLSKTTVRRALRALESAGLVESDSYQRRGKVWLDGGGDG